MSFNNKTPRQLSENTIERYDAEQLIRHLARFLDRAFPQDAPYRVGGGVLGDIYKLEADAYVFHCSSAFKDEVEEVLRDAYSLARSSH